MASSTQLETAADTRDTVEVGTLRDKAAYKVSPPKKSLCTSTNAVKGGAIGGPTSAIGWNYAENPDGDGRCLFRRVSHVYRRGSGVRERRYSEDGVRIRRQKTSRWRGEGDRRT